MSRGNYDGYYPAHASRPVRIRGVTDTPRRVHEAQPDEDITGLDIWDNDERSPVEAWRAWFAESGAGAFWADVDCVECELGRHCPRSPPCLDADVDSSHGQT